MSQIILDSLLALNQVEQDRELMIAEEGSGGPSATVEHYREKISGAVKRLVEFTKDQVLEVFDANISSLTYLNRGKVAEIFSN